MGSEMPFGRQPTPRDGGPQSSITIGSAVGRESSLDTPPHIFSVPERILQRLLERSILKMGRNSVQSSGGLGVHKLPLHRLSLLSTPRVIDAQSLYLTGYGRHLDNPLFPVSATWTPLQLSPLPTPITSPLTSPTSQLVTQDLTAAHPSSSSRAALEPFKALNYSTWSLSREQRTIMHGHKWRTYPSFLPPPMSGTLERVSLFALQMFILGSFFHVPLLAYAVYKRFCTTRRKKVIFFICFSLLIFCPIPECSPARRWSLWKLLHRYHRTTVVVEDLKCLPAKRPVIYTALPHGIVPVAQALLPLNDFNSLIGHFRLAIASIVKRVPVWGHFACVTGAQDATRAKLREALTINGDSVVIVPGGIAEMYAINPSTERLHLNERTGLLKLALETGADIVPIYCFGNTDTFKLTKGCRSLQPIARLFRTALLLFYGRFGLPVSFEVPLLYVIGKALRLPKIRHPSTQDIEAAQKQYLAAVQRIFNTYKGLYGWQHKSLEIV